jgi:salicylate hydroxylase
MIALRCRTGPPDASRLWETRPIRWFPTSARAIEDGFTLAVLLEGCSADNVADRLKVYEALRRERTGNVQALARAAGKLYRSEHDDPSEKAVRLREWMAQGKWVFEHDAEKAATDALADLGH